MMQPPARRAAHAAVLGRFVIKYEYGNNRRAAGDSRGQCRLIGKAQVAAQPEDYRCGHIASINNSELVIGNVAYYCKAISYQ